MVQAAAVDHGRPGDDSGGPHRRTRTPRFLLTVGASGDLTQLRGSPRLGWPPWFQIHEVDKDGREHLVESVDPPSPSPGALQAIVAGPGGTFLALASRATPCESQLYRFRLAADGHATGIAPVDGGATPALVAGLAVSPDGRKVAFATAPCADERSRGVPPDTERPPRAATSSPALTVLDLTTGQRRGWTTGGIRLIGEIVWARDSRTLGYTIAEVVPGTRAPLPTSVPPSGYSRRSRGDRIDEVAVHALDTDAPGTDLLAGRVLFRTPRDAGTVTTAVMDLNGRGGYGMLRKGDPATTILFSFTEGQPMHVTKTMPPDPNGGMMAISVSTGDEPRYACLNGVDAFGRVIEGSYAEGLSPMGGCTSTYDTEP